MKAPNVNFNAMETVEIIFALGIVVALIQSGYYKELGVVASIVTGIFGYMKGVVDGKKQSKELNNEKIVPDTDIANNI